LELHDILHIHAIYIYRVILPQCCPNLNLWGIIRYSLLKVFSYQCVFSSINKKQKKYFSREWSRELGQHWGRLTRSIDFLWMEMRLRTCEYDWKRWYFSILWKKRRNTISRTSPATTHRAKKLTRWISSGA
jgi:hypothetical protein